MKEEEKTFEDFLHKLKINFVTVWLKRMIRKEVENCRLFIGKGISLGHSKHIIHINMYTQSYIFYLCTFLKGVCTKTNKKFMTFDMDWKSFNEFYL